MKIKEIVNPTLRWAVIKRLLDRVPDRPAGAGNFVSGGQFSEPSRRTMPGRHAAERAAKQVWNEVVDELGSRPFFDDALVRVHWIGLYTKRGQDLASNTISYIQEHAGVEHADEISATAYLREDLAKVTFSRPMIGVILRGRTTYAGAVDLGTQWSVKLKPEDIERQKGSGTRKLPWYEDEGTIADNMTVDETSWRDHVWGPQFYRTKMPELVVGSWSFDTVLIPQGVMSGAHDDLQRVIEVASSLGCKVVDERGNRYEPSEKTQITEAQLRSIIKSILINESTEAYGPNSYANVGVDGNLYHFGNELFGHLAARKTNELLTELLKLFGNRRKDRQAIEPLLIGTAITFIMEYKDDVWDVYSRIKPARGMEPLEPPQPGAKLTSSTGVVWKRNDSLYSGAEPPDALIDSIERQIKAQLDKIDWSTFADDLKPDETQQFCLICKTGELNLTTCSPAPRIA